MAGLPTTARENWPIVIGGFFRSGTSLVRRILDAHSRIHCGPEVKFFRDFYGDYLDDQLNHARFASSARSILPEDELLRILGGAFVDLHQCAAERQCKLRWADKCPENLVYLDQWHSLLGQQWMLVHVVRNPLDALASLKNHPFPKVVPQALDARVALFLRYHQSGLDFADLHPQRYQRILYEDLVLSPRQTLRVLMRALGEQFEPVQLAFNRVSHQTGLEDPRIAITNAVHRGSLGRWRDILSKREADLIWRQTKEFWTQVSSGNDAVLSECALPN